MMDYAKARFSHPPGPYEYKPVLPVLVHAQYLQLVALPVRSSILLHRYEVVVAVY